ncbi:amidase family protein [Pelagibaculum spongiae]|uniref:Amidase domain-containing protein n=1 Tax=Pelagibaculum spongiae TaxID=2080658 RepID=A0A2V1H1B5_9GAMM|nr:amidase family protein [Pelagibaculum spongiae]PVZ70161.1 hypothetical protein DC094_06045 [Pelagibaculum spongiae]
MPNLKKTHDLFKKKVNSVKNETIKSLELIKEQSPKFIFTKITEQLALRQAIASDQRYTNQTAKSRLDGATVVWKDLFDQRGFQTLAGSKTRLNCQPALKNAQVVEQLEKAGMISLARTNTTEFAFSGLGCNPHFGTPNSALTENEPLLPGGSSAGSAVAVGLGLAQIGMGTDTSGSIRVPAALNGVFGFRPSTDRYSRDGVFTLSKSLDSVGTIANSLSDIKSIDRILAPNKQQSKKISRTILDISDSIGISWSNTAYRAYEKELIRLESHGFNIEKSSLKSILLTKSLFTSYGTLVAIEAKRRYQALLDSPQSGLIDPFVLHRLKAAPVISDKEYMIYLEQRKKAILLACQETLGSIIASPTVPEIKIETGSISDNFQKQQQTNSELLTTTMIGSFIDLAGIAIPIKENNKVDGSILLSTASKCDQLLINSLSLYGVDS